MKIGVIGIGQIAQKAYLPNYVMQQDQAAFYFATSNPATRKLLNERYGFSHVYRTLKELIAAGIEACLIHSATKSHFVLAEACLQKGIHVFVDKPASEDLLELEKLQRLAAEKNLILMVGFNRRFAPRVDQLKAVPNKRLLLLQKNRVAEKLPVDFALFDLFIHLIDTAVYLLDEPILQVKSKIHETDGYLQTALLQLTTETTTAILTMDLVSGANREVYEVTSPCGTYRLTDLVELTTFKNGQTIKQTGDDWEATLTKRGFTPMVEAFLSAVKNLDQKNLRQEKIHLSHELGEQMIRTHQRQIL